MSTRNRECGEFFPLGGWGEGREVDERNAVDHGMADLDHAAESGQSLLVDLFVGQKFRVIEKIAQEPAELPHRLLGTVETTANRLSGQCPGLKNGESKDVERFVGVPAELGAIDAHEEDPVRNLRTRIAGSFGKAWDLAFHATTSCFGRAYLLSWQSRALRSFSAQSASCWTKFSTCSLLA